MTRLHLLIDGLDDETVLRHPHLAKLIARGRQDGPAEPGYHTALARLFGVQTSHLPAIEYAARFSPVDDTKWFRADPVHLLAGMHSLTLFDIRQAPLNDLDSTTLITLLNRHFAGEIEFLADQPMRWYARFAKSLEIEAAPLDEVVGRPVSPDQIAGPDARALQRIGMEIQMLLHDHPINLRREEDNLPTINSIWFWGGGGFRQPGAGYTVVYAEEESACALAGLAGMTVQPLPAKLGPANWLGDGLMVLNTLAGHPDADPCWFQPILRGLQTRQIQEVRLHPCGQTSRIVTNGDSLAFWRRRTLSG